MKKYLDNIEDYKVNEDVYVKLLNTGQLYSRFDTFFDMVGLGRYKRYWESECFPYESDRNNWKIIYRCVPHPSQFKRGGDDYKGKFLDVLKKDNRVLLIESTDKNPEPILYWGHSPIYNNIWS